MNKNYDDIINMPRHKSERHTRMSMHDRAAQFSPFAALTGYNAEIAETARLTDSRIELTDEEKSILDTQLRNAEESKRTVCITYFVPDSRKSGGAYVDAVGQVKKVDSINRMVCLMGGREISIEDIFAIGEASEM